MQHQTKVIALITESKCRNYTLGVFVPEAKPRDTNITVGIISIWYFNKEHILIARSKAEGMFHINNAHFYPENCIKNIKCRNYTRGAFWARGIAEERPLKNVISKFICFCIDSHVPKISSWKCLDSEKSARTESMVQSSTKFGGISQAIKLKINIIEPKFSVYIPII